jgi:two-component system chemotaxis response regulator CheB
MIRVLIVEDSPVQAELLSYLLSSDPGIVVAGVVHTGEEAVDAAMRMKPHVITMDINLPGINGFEATRKIMETVPTPIVIVSGSYDPKEVATTFHALEAGALAVVEKPPGINHVRYVETAGILVQTVKAMSEVKLVRRWPRKKAPVPATLPTMERKQEIKIVAIGGSTGAPVVLQTILSSLPRDFPVPIVVVQHMATGFTEGFAQWLATSTGFPVRLAANGQALSAGQAYVAPDGFHMKVVNAHVALTKEEPQNGLRPSVSNLFRSVLEVFGLNTAAVLLSGMGKDGAEELQLLKESGAYTIVQNQESCVVYGMPGEAVRLNAASFILPPEDIADVLIGLVRRGRQQ